MNKTLFLGLLFFASGGACAADQESPKYASAIKKCPRCGRVFHMRAAFPHQGCSPAVAAQVEYYVSPAQKALYDAIGSTDCNAVTAALRDGAFFDGMAFATLSSNPDVDVAKQIVYLLPRLRTSIKDALGPVGELL